MLMALKFVHVPQTNPASDYFFIKVERVTEAGRVGWR